MLCNFAAVQRMELLEEFLGGAGRWVQAIEAETMKSRDFHPALQDAVAGNWFGAAIDLDQGNEAELVEQFRQTHMFGDPSLPFEHLGESETYVLLKHRPEFSNASFLTDDHDAFRISANFGIRVQDTFDIVTALVGRVSLSGEEGVSLLQDMELAGRNLRRVPSRASDFPI